MKKKLFTLILAYSICFEGESQVWKTLPGGPLNGDLSSAIRFGPYMWFGGLFNNGGPVASPFIIRHDGFQWIATPFTNGVPVNFCIFNNELYAFGGFDIGPLRYGIMKWNGAGWTPLAQLLSGESMRSGTVYKGELVVGGRFTSINSASIEYIARYDGANWYAFSGGPILCGWLVEPDINQVYAANNYLYVAGSFDKICGVNSSCTAKWDGTSWYALSIGTNTSASSFMSYGGNVYVSGTFQNAGPATSQGVAKEDTVAGDWSNAGNGVKLNALTMALYQSKLYIAGNDEPGSGDFVGNCGYWNGTNWVADNQGINNSGAIILMLYTDPLTGVLYAGGSFNTQIGDTTDYLAYKSSSPLPVVLAQFDVECEDNGECVNVEWTTYSEHENMGFSLLREGKEVAFISSCCEGYSNVPHVYTYRDCVPMSGENENSNRTFAYRLIQVDYNGERTDLGVRVVRCSEMDIGVIYENEMLQIARVHADTKISVEVIDVAGKTVAKNICQGECEFSLRSLATGIYVAKVMFNNKVISRKIVK